MKFRSLIALMFMSVLMLGCSSVMSTEGAYTVDASAYTVLTTEEAVLSRPCTATVTTMCVDKSLAVTLRDSRILVMAALHNYQSSRKAYNAAIASGVSDNSSAMQAAYTSLMDAIRSANELLALETVRAILASINS